MKEAVGDRAGLNEDSCVYAFASNFHFMRKEERKQDDDRTSISIKRRKQTYELVTSDQLSSKSLAATVPGLYISFYMLLLRWLTALPGLVQILWDL
jgi:hypothetical protein